MSDKAEAAKNVVVLARFMRGLLAIAPDLERVGSMEDHEARLKRSIEDLKTEANQWKSKIGEHRGAVEADAASAAEKIRALDETLKAKAAEHDAYALAKRKEGDDLIIIAKKSADGIIADAKKQAKDFTDKTNLEVNAVDEKISAAKATLAGLNTEITAHQNILADLKSKFAPALAS